MNVHFSSLSILGLCCVTAGAAVYSTSFDGLTPGNLGGQDGWVAQGQWQVPAGGGQVESTSGAFIRAQNTTVQYDNAVNQPVTIATTFSLIGNQMVATNAPLGFQEPIFVLGLTEGVTLPAPGVRGTTGLAWEPSTSQLVLRGPGFTDVNLGGSGALDGATIQLNVVYERLNATTFSINASIDNLDNADPAFTATGSFSSAELDAATVIGGVMQVLPSGGTAGPDVNVFGGVSVTDFSFTTVPEPSSAILVALAGSLGLIRRRA